jgi:enamine deaminase RidA (YjgF/YER057c/UK114 family)
MIRSFNPKSVAPPSATYTHVYDIPANARLVILSGQIGTKPDGTVPPSIEEQADCVWTNISNCIKEAGLEMRDIVKVTTYVTKPEYFEKVRLPRARLLGEHKPASTSLCVLALARPEMLVEVEVIAAKL